MKKFIVFEGIDGAGKGTQIALLAKRLRKEGKRFSLTRSPNDKSAMGKIIQRALNGEFGDFVGMNGYLSSMPYLLDLVASREHILAALKRGILISDRYIPSSLAYQSANLSEKERAAFVRMVEDLMYRTFRMPKPDVVLYFDVPASAAQHNIRSKKRDQFEKNAAFQKKVASLYKKFAKDKGWKIIPCVKNGKMRSPEEIHEMVWKAVHPMR